MKKLTFIIVALLTIVVSSHSQEITKMGRAKLSYNTNTADNGFYDKDNSRSFCICWFSYNYPSISGDGQPVTLSAMACMPDKSQNVTRINNVIAGCHATISANKECPTEFNRSRNLFSDVFLTMILAGDKNKPQDNLAYHNLIILPDYEGFGVTKTRTHPYLCEEVTARQVTDAVRYGIELYQNDEQVNDMRLPFREDWRTICTGYSQGGSVAMATQRYIEEHGLSGELHLGGSLCGDGPYSPLATILYYLEQDRKGVEMSLPVVLPLMLNSLCYYDETTKSHQVSDYLNERFLETGVLDWLASKEMTLEDIENTWKNLYKNGKNGDKNYYRSVLTSSGGAYLSNIFKPQILNYFGQVLDHYPNYATTIIPLPDGGTLAEDLHIALEHNNLTLGWTPSHPVCLYHSTGDDVVPFENYQSAASNLGTQVQFYESAQNGKHFSTGTEFFISTVRTDCISLLAQTPEESDIVALPHPGNTTANATNSWYDLSGRLVVGKPTTKGIYIHNGKKMNVR